MSFSVNHTGLNHLSFRQQIAYKYKRLWTKVNRLTHEFANA